MRYFFLSVIGITMFFLNSTYAYSNTDNEKNKSSVDLMELISYFLIPSSENYNIPSWFSGAEQDSPIEWITDGIDFDNQKNEFTREGNVVITIAGKPVNILRKKIEPHQWGIKIFGARSGISRVEISSNITSQEISLDLESEMNKRNIEFSKYKCDSMGAFSSGERLYEVKIPEKKTCWLDYSWSCGSAGCSADIKVFLNKESADSIPELITECPSLR